MKVNLGVRMGSEKVHATVGEVLGLDGTLGVVDSTDITDERLGCKTTLDLFRILLVYSVKVPTDNVFHLLFHTGIAAQGRKGTNGIRR